MTNLLRISLNPNIHPELQEYGVRQPITLWVEIECAFEQGEELTRYFLKRCPLLIKGYDKHPISSVAIVEAGDKKLSCVFQDWTESRRHITVPVEELEVVSRFPTIREGCDY